MSAQNFILKKYLRYAYKPRFTAGLSLEEARREQASLIEKYMPEPPHSVAVDSTELGGINCQQVRHKRRPASCVVLYVHGGLFAMGSPDSHLGISAELAQDGSFKVIVPDYRLAPEHPYPGALEDLLAVYGQLVDIAGNLPIVLMGDQAGACLAFLLALQVRDLQITRPPVALVGLSSLLDLSFTSPSMETNRDSDCLYTPIIFERCRDYYLAADADPYDPTISPLFASLHGLPPVLLQVSNTEMLLDDSVGMAKRLEQHGVPATLDIWQDVPSCWQCAAMALPEGRKAVRVIRRFIRKRF